MNIITQSTELPLLRFRRAVGRQTESGPVSNNSVIRQGGSLPSRGRKLPISLHADASTGLPTP